MTPDALVSLMVGHSPHVKACVWRGVLVAAELGREFRCSSQSRVKPPVLRGRVGEALHGPVASPKESSLPLGSTILKSLIP